MVIDPSKVVITDHQAELVAEWLRVSARAPEGLGTYGLGGSYVDTRARKGAASDGRQAFVEFDHEVARQVPELDGHYARDIQEYMDARVNPAPAMTMS